MSHDLEHRAETELTQVPTQASVEAKTKNDEVRPETQTPPRRNRRGLWLKIGAPAAAVAAAGGLFLGLKANGGDNPGTTPNDDPQGQEQIDPNGGNHEDDPITDPTPEVTDTPDVGSVEAWQEEIAKRVEIPVGLSTQDLGQKIVDDLNYNLNVGPQDPDLDAKTLEFINRTGEIPDDTFVDEYIPAYHEAFEDTIFADDIVFKNAEGEVVNDSIWQAERDLSAFVLEGYLGTYRDESMPEPFRVEYNLESVEELESDQPDTRVILLGVTMSHNADTTNGFITMPDTNQYNKGSVFNMQLTLQNQGGVEKIVEYSFL